MGGLPKSLVACEVGVPAGTDVSSSSGSLPSPADTRGAPKIAPGAVSDIRRESFDKRPPPYRPALPPGKQPLLHIGTGRSFTFSRGRCTLMAGCGAGASQRSS